MRNVSIAVLVAFALAACSGDDASGTAVAMTAGQAFSPEELTITAGETVTWTNGSPESHTVTASEDGLPEGASYFASGGASSEEAARDDLDAGLLTDGETFEVTFDAPGTYQYVCIPHEEQGMVGTIVVEE